MNRYKTLSVVLAVLLSLLGSSCTSVPHPSKQSVIFEATYSQTKAPCIEMGDSHVMFMADSFEVVEVVEGELKPTSIYVRPLSLSTERYPKKMVIGKTYTLKLTPSTNSISQIEERKKDGYPFIWINADELERYP